MLYLNANPSCFFFLHIKHLYFLFFFLVFKMKSCIESCFHKDNTNQKLYNLSSKFKCEQRIPFRQASKTSNLLVLFLYIILYLHSLHLIESLDFISLSAWHSPRIYIIGCCLGVGRHFGCPLLVHSTQAPVFFCSCSCGIVLRSLKVL